MAGPAAPWRRIPRQSSVKEESKGRTSIKLDKSDRTHAACKQPAMQGGETVKREGRTWRIFELNIAALRSVVIHRLDDGRDGAGGDGGERDEAHVSSHCFTQVVAPHYLAFFLARTWVCHAPRAILNAMSV
jgi:hypothetical protein